MNLEAIKDRLDSIFCVGHMAQIYLMLKVDNNIIVKQLDLEDNYAEPEIRNMFTEYLKENVIHKEHSQLASLSKSEHVENRIFHYDFKKLPEELELINSIDANFSKNVEKYNFKKDDLSNLFGYFVYLGSMKDGVILFKKHYPVSLIKKNSHLFGIDKNRAVLMNESDLIKLNSKIELFKIDKQIYIIEPKVLQKMKGFADMMKEDAMQSITLISSLNLVNNLELLSNSLEDFSFCSKLSKVCKTSPVLRNNIPAEKIVAFTKNNSLLVNKFRYSDDGKKIILDTKKSKNDFIRLLNDSFLHSELTEQYYDAISKEELE